MSLIFVMDPERDPQITKKIWEEGFVPIYMDHHSDPETLLRGALETVARCDGVLVTSGWDASEDSKQVRAFAESIDLPVWIFPAMPSDRQIHARDWHRDIFQAEREIIEDAFRFAKTTSWKSLQEVVNPSLRVIQVAIANLLSQGRIKLQGHLFIKPLRPQLRQQPHPQGDRACDSKSPKGRPQ